MSSSTSQTVVLCNTPDNFTVLNKKLENLHLIIPESGSEFQAPFLKSPKSASGSPATPKGHSAERESSRTPTNTNLFPAISPSIHAPADISAFNFKNPKKLIEELLDECKTKTKKLLLVKLGREVENLGIQESVSLQEENTLIKSLCDLLDRVWSHGLAVKKVEKIHYSIRISLYKELMNELQIIIWVVMIFFPRKNFITCSGSNVLFSGLIFDFFLSSVNFYCSKKGKLQNLNSKIVKVTKNAIDF